VSNTEKNNKTVRHFLTLAMKTFDKTKQTEGECGASAGPKEDLKSLEFKLFVATLLAQLPYHSMDSVLVLIKTLQERSGALAGNCFDGLKRCLATSSQEELQAVPVGLAHYIEEAQCLSVVVQLDKFLQHAYSVKPDRIRKWDSKTNDKNPVKGADKDRMPFDLSVVHFTKLSPGCSTCSVLLTEQTKKELRLQCKSLRYLMQGNFVADEMEEIDAAEEGADKAKKKKTVLKPRSKGKKRAKRDEVDSEEEEDENVVQDKEVGQGSTAPSRTSSRASAKKRAYIAEESESSETETPEKPPKKKGKEGKKRR